MAASRSVRSVHQVELDDLDTGAAVDGVAVVIDVIRAFTTQSAAVAAGVRRFVCVEEIDDALALRSALSGSLLMGEEQGLPPDGFDLGNSPLAFYDPAPSWPELVVQRTSNGTRGLERTGHRVRYAAAAVNATATARHIIEHHPDEQVMIVSTYPTGEDQACAAFIADLLVGATPDRALLSAAVLEAGHGMAERVAERGAEEQRVRDFSADVRACAEVDRYDRALVGAPMLGSELGLGGEFAGRAFVVVDAQPSLGEDLPR